jgi:hypothetical protein
LGGAQGFELSEGKTTQRLKFRLVNNLIVVPMEVNGAKLSFILDSGVSKPILFNLSGQDSIALKDVSEITIRGLGEGEPIKALSSVGNSFKLKDLVNHDQQLYVVIDHKLNFSPTLGIPIHGIIGYDIFRNHIVDVNYKSQVIRFYKPGTHVVKTGRRTQTLPLSIINNKPYIDGKVMVEDADNVGVRLLVDTGSSDAVWLFPDSNRGLEVPLKHYDDFLGKGLSGNIFGKRTMVNSLKIGDFNFSDAKAAFPDMRSFGALKSLGSRNGSIGGEILRRFNIVFDYPGNSITLTKNGNYKDSFQFNISGIELQHNGVRYIAERIADSRGVVKSDERDFGDVQILLENRTRLSLVPEIIVSGIRAGSPAAEAGLQEGDIILAVNGKSIHRYKLQEVMRMLNEKEGKRVRVLIERYNRDLLFSFVLRSMFK